MFNGAVSSDADFALGKPGATRLHSSISGIKAIENFLKANKAVLV